MPVADASRLSGTTRSPPTLVWAVDVTLWSTATLPPSPPSGGPSVLLNPSVVRPPEVTRLPHVQMARWKVACARLPVQVAPPSDPTTTEGSPAHAGAPDSASPVSDAPSDGGDSGDSFASPASWTSDPLSAVSPSADASSTWMASCEVPAPSGVADPPTHPPRTAPAPSAPATVPATIRRTRAPLIAPSRCPSANCGDGSPIFPGYEATSAAVDGQPGAARRLVAGSLTRAQRPAGVERCRVVECDRRWTRATKKCREEGSRRAGDVPAEPDASHALMRPGRSPLVDRRGRRECPYRPVGGEETMVASNRIA